MLVDSDNPPLLSDETRWTALHEKKLEHELVESFRYFTSRGLEPVLIKGWAAARNYPAGVSRFYTDIDLAFSPEEYETVARTVQADPKFKYNVDLHCGLRHLDTMPWNRIFSGSRIVRLDNCDVRIPADEDHLRILAVHWLNDGGEHKEKLWDIFYAVENRPEDFDWQKCLETVSANRRAWIVIAIGIAHRYLGLSIDDLPFASEAKDLPNWLTRRLEREWQYGVRLRPLALTLGAPTEFIRQTLKRLPPNPIQATIEMEGDLRDRRRLIYQLGSLKSRIAPSAINFKHRVFGSEN